MCGIILDIHVYLSFVQDKRIYAAKNGQETKKMLDQVNDAIRVKQFDKHAKRFLCIICTPRGLEHQFAEPRFQS